PCANALPAWRAARTTAQPQTVLVLIAVLAFFRPLRAGTGNRRLPRTLAANGLSIIRTRRMPELTGISLVPNAPRISVLGVGQTRKSRQADCGFLLLGRLPKLENEGTVQCGAGRRPATVLAGPAACPTRFRGRMTSHELRDGDQARRFLLEGLWLQRVLAPTTPTVAVSLRWALEAASAGQPLPPLGFIADLGHVALGQDQGPRSVRDALGSAGLPAGLARTYEDYVLGKLYADWHFERASDAVRRYQGRDQDRGLAFILNQFHERSGFPGVWLSPAVIRGLR